jgi:hypothetical protein
MWKYLEMRKISKLMSSQTLVMKIKIFLSCGTVILRIIRKNILKHPKKWLLK